MNVRFAEALKTVGGKLNRHGIKWVLGGSASLVLNGVKVKPRDIDVLVSKRDVFKVNELLKQHEVTPVKFGRFGPFESYYGRFDVGGVRVDVMADSKIRDRATGQWFSTRRRLAFHETVDFSGLRVPVTRLADHLRSYERLARGKDGVKIKRIREALQLRKQS
jgi:predicted nucleotidyltransferase